MEKHSYLIISLKLSADVMDFKSVFLANSENEKRQGSWLFIYHLTALNQQGAVFILFNLSVEYLPFIYSPFQSTLDYSRIEESINVNNRRLPHLGLSSLPQQHWVPEMETN